MESTTRRLARVHAALVLTLKGTPFLYNGEEIGMTDLVLTELSQFRDTQAVALYHLLVEDQGLAPAQALAAVARSTRDACRTPMQWATCAKRRLQSARGAHLAAGQPELCRRRERRGAGRRCHSLLTFYRRLLGVRRATPALTIGDYAALDQEAEDYLVFTRAAPEQTVLVALSFAEQARTVALKQGMQPTRVLFSSVERPSASEVHGPLELAPFEVYIAEVARLGIGT